MRNKDFSKECIFNALAEIMKNKDYLDIQINEICEKAGFNRSTFYRNFSSKLDILNYKIEIEALKYKKLVDESNDQTFIYKVTKMFELLRDSFYIFYQIRKAKLDSYLYDVFKRIYPFSEEELKQKYYVEFKSAGVFQVIMKWMDNGMIESNDEMALLLKNIINSCVVE